MLPSIHDPVPGFTYYLRGKSIGCNVWGGASPGITVTFEGPTPPSISALPDLCIDAGVQAGLSGVTPGGGTYSGDGVTDNGDGTYDFDPAAAGVGVHTITYEITDGNSCSNSASDDVEVFGLPEANSVTLTACPSTPGGNSAGFTLTDAEDPDAPSNGDSFFDLDIDVDGDGGPGTPASISVSYHPTATDAQNGQDEITGVPFNSTSTVIYARVENTNTGCAQVRPIRLVVKEAPEAPEVEAVEICQGDDTNPPLMASCVAPPNIIELLFGFSPSGPGPDAGASLVLFDPGAASIFSFSSLDYERCNNMEFDPARGSFTPPASGTTARTSGCW